MFPEKKRPIHPHTGQKCSATCGALDPVNEPDYNMREVIKNTLLIEDHLANKNKYCKECLVKHYLLSISYLEEAVWMACDHCKDYPKLEESEKFFKDIFEKWHKNMDDDATRLECLAKIREWRQEMIRLYYFNGEQHS
jgi:hypothetical protein